MDHLLDHVLRLIPDTAFVAVDPNGMVTYCNPLAAEWLSCPVETILGGSLEELIDHPLMVLFKEREWRQKLQGGAVLEREILLAEENRSLVVQTRLTGISDETGYEHGYLFLALNITRLQRAEDISACKEEESRLELAARVFESSSEAIFITDIAGKILQVNRAFSEITGYSTEEAEGQTPRLIRSDRHDEAFYRDMWNKLENAGFWESEIWNRRKDGEVFPAWSRITALQNEQGKVDRYIASFSDITESNHSRARIQHLTHYDILTNLPNRLLFNERCEHALHHAHREGNQRAVLIVGLDHFKHINDGLGYLAGDEVLREVGTRLQSIVRENDTVARLGGDEFGLLMEQVTTTQAVTRITEKVMSLFGQPFKLSSKSLRVSASVGISLYPGDGTDALTLVKNADAAMYRAKAKGRNTFCFYTSEMTSNALERLNLEASLRSALKKEQFRVYYQPKYSPQEGKFTGAEALIRWEHPEKGIISPDKFIPLAEETGLIVPIGEWVLRAACAQVAKWRQEGLLINHIAVNVAGLQILRSNLVETVQQVLAETGLDPAVLEIEITETFIMQQKEKSIGTFKKLRAMGVELAIDDFGTGYSSLAYLKQLPVTRLKIDRSFVSNILDDKDNRAIATAVIALGHSLGLKITAEGIEEEDQARFLYALQCDEGQGYLYSPPISADEFEILLERP